MKIELTTTPLLSPQKIGELASSLDTIYHRVVKTIDRVQENVDKKKAEVANRWKTVGISMQDSARYATDETAAVVRGLLNTTRAELDAVWKEIKPIHLALESQKPYYDSPVKVLARAALGSPERTAYLQQLAYAGPGELGHMAQVAVGTKNVPLAAAVVSLIDAKPANQRPLAASALAAAMELDGYVKVQEYFKIGEARLQGISLAVRTWQSGRSNPLNTVSLALRNRDIDLDALLDGDD